MSKLKLEHAHTEQSLIQGCIDEERVCQKLLFEIHSPFLMAISYRYAGNRVDAEDILQDAFVKIFQKITTFQNQGSFEGWLKRITVNTALEHLRKKIQLVSITEMPEMETTNPTPIQHLQKKDMMNLIKELSDGCRVVFNLFVVEGYKHQEIAKILDISVGTSKSQLNRAKELLKKKINFIERSEKHGR
ncbi:MAG: RNA polymerase sigma factor (sigma-70 family) [Sphingobacteriales bacterium]|jgi:RNA polymerase sigma factor (sigma-70 family)